MALEEGSNDYVSRLASDIIEFIVSKMQNPRVLKWLVDNSSDEQIKYHASNKLKFVPLTNQQIEIYETITRDANADIKLVNFAHEQLMNGGHFEVVNQDFLSGANISVTLTDEFMEAVKNDSTYDLRFPDLDNYTVEEKQYYDNHWMEVGDIHQWPLPLKVYRTVKARDIWDLICFCATYSAEPGIFFIDNANKMTNATAYGQKVVATNPCGEQPLAPYSVCNLAAVNLANFVNKTTGEILYDKLAETVQIAVRLQDNVIDSTPYFLKQNEIQALGERRVGLGVMGLHDLLIWAGKRYGSEEALNTIDAVFHCIATNAYRQSIELAKEKAVSHS